MKILGYVLLGLFFGLVLVVIATLVQLTVVNQPITLENIIKIQLTTPLLWIIDIVPLLLAATFGILGSRERDLVVRSKEGSEAQKRAAELRRLNTELAKRDQERRDIEAVISRGKKEWEATFDSVEELIFVTDPNGLVTRCNRAATKAFNTDFNQIIGKPVNELFFGSSTNPQDQLQAVKSEVKFPVLEGWYEVTSDPFVTEGQPQGTIFIIRNVTERKQAVLDLQRQKQFYESLVQNIPVGIATLSLDHRLVACNPAFENLFGYTQSEVIGQNIDNILAPGDLFEETRTLTQSVEKGHLVHKITKRLRKDGSFLDVEVFGVPVILWGKQIGILGMYHDVTKLIRPPIVAPTIEPAPQEVQTVEPVETAMTVEEVVEEMPKAARQRLIKIETIEGIGPVYAQKLAEIGIVTTNDLLEAGKTRKGRQELVEKTQISDKLILKWVNRADLMRVSGIGEEYSDLLEVAGVDTVKELRNRNPENLYQKMLQINEEKHLVRRPPHLSEVEAWIQGAKELEPMMTY